MTPTLTQYFRGWSVAGACIVALGVCVPGIARGSEHAAPPSEHGAAEGSEPEPDSNSNGIKLGEFSIRSDYPAEAQKSTVRFTLFATIKGDQLATMKRIVANHRYKVRDDVITATRLTPLGVFEEPNLTTFRRRIMVRLHRTIPELVIDQLYISDFALSVKSL
ncbi:MAG: hypothetical protein IT425_05005 [Pirellulales bacterium]|nr:hypothetical protein [Pirellulales bacterium]